MIKAVSTTAILLCLLSTFAASAQSPVISSITPQEGTTEGGTRVRIDGQNLTPPCRPGCQMPLVEFGGVRGLRVEAYSAARIEVVTPPHRAGSVDVRLTRPDGPFTVAPSAFTFLDIPSPSVERILLPVVVSRSTGAFGSEWESELTVHSEAGGLRSLSVAWAGCQITCPGEPVSLDRGATRTFRGAIYYDQTASRPGALLYAIRNEADLFSFSLHIMDRSRSATNAGTEIPVIRERELYAGRIILLNVPFKSGFRNLLRIYDPFPLDDTPVVRVRVISVDNEILLERSIGLESLPSNPLVPAYPGYAQLADFGDVQSRLGSGQNARIEIEPLTPGLKFWAFVAVTNNDTQHVTTITPQ